MPHIEFEQDTLQWSPLQEKALKLAEKWLREAKQFITSNRTNAFKTYHQQVFYLAGYAGTGKTTLARYLAESVDGTVLYAAFTGKAALRMRELGCYNASTIHSLIYNVREREQEEERAGKNRNEPSFVLNPNSQLASAKLLIIDECSMVSEEVGKDLLSFGVPIMVLGDPAQLPPVKGTGFFTARRPNITLTEVHRQALDSPIIQVATAIREGKNPGRFIAEDRSVMFYPLSRDFNLDEHLSTDHQFLTGRNKTRIRLNEKIRSRVFNGQLDTIYPLVGDTLICLRNARQRALFNGLMGTVTHVHESSSESILLDLKSSDSQREHKKIAIHPECFDDPAALKQLSWQDRKMLDEFDYGYCITVHKSQGSQWDSVIVCDDGFLNWDLSQRHRWLYTAVTRAAKNLVVVRGAGR